MLASHSGHMLLSKRSLFGLFALSNFVTFLISTQTQLLNPNPSGSGCVQVQAQEREPAFLPASLSAVPAACPACPACAASVCPKPEAPACAACPAKLPATPPMPDAVQGSGSCDFGFTLCADTWSAYRNQHRNEVTVLGEKFNFISIDEKWLRVVEGEFAGDQYGIKRYLSTNPDPKIIFDVGANIGFFSVIMGKLFPNATIYAFEPVQINFAHLNWNLGANGITNVLTFNFGLSDVTDLKLIQSIHHWNQGGSTMENIKENWDFDSFHVQGRSLDDTLKLLELDNDTPIDYFKLDCEGCENLAFPPDKPNIQRFLKRVQAFGGEAHFKEGESNTNGYKQYRAIDFTEEFQKVHPELTCAPEKETWVCW